MKRHLVVVGFALGGCRVESEVHETDPIAGTEGCGVLSAIEVESDEPAAFGPSSDVVLVAVDDAVREATFRNATGASGEPWEDTITVGVVPTGPTLEVELEAPSEADGYCVAGRFRLVPVDFALAGEHFAGSGTGALRWNGDDLDQALYVTVQVPDLVVDSWVEGIAESVAGTHVDCSADFASFHAGTDFAVSRPWGSLVLHISGQTGNCSMNVASSDGIWTNP